jgi:hypothetical protein
MTVWQKAAWEYKDGETICKFARLILASFHQIDSASNTTNTDPESKHQQCKSHHRSPSTPTNITSMHIQNLLALAALPSLISAWTLQLGGDVWDGKSNQGCKGDFTHVNGQMLSWDRSFFSDCCVHLYADHKCSHQVGISCPDWKKTLSQTVGSFKVTDC